MNFGCKKIVLLFGFIISTRAFCVDFPTSNSILTDTVQSFPGATDSDAELVNIEMSAEKFPQTINNLSFLDNTENLTMGYAHWESEYDKDGNCVSNCAYPGIRIEDEIKLAERNTVQAQAELDKLTSQYSTNIQAPGASLADINKLIPYGKPLAGRLNVTSGFGIRMHPVRGITEPHNGIDLGCQIGTPVYSTANGVVEAVWQDDRCGKAVRIRHGYRFSTLYCHLDKQLVKPGDYVSLYSKIGLSGNTGTSTGPHLHYAIYYNKKFVNPSKYIGRLNN